MITIELSSGEEIVIGGDIRIQFLKSEHSWNRAELRIWAPFSRRIERGEMRDRLVLQCDVCGRRHHDRSLEGRACGRPMKSAGPSSPHCVGVMRKIEGPRGEGGRDEVR
jgi:sRNA-binding carbon storage regulator CsrA